MQLRPFSGSFNTGLAMLIALALALGTAFVMTSPKAAAAVHNGDIAEMGTPVGGWTVAP